MQQQQQQQVAAGGNSWRSLCQAACCMPRSNCHILIGAGILAGQMLCLPRGPNVALPLICCQLQSAVAFVLVIPHTHTYKHEDSVCVPPCNFILLASPVWGTTHASAHKMNALCGWSQMTNERQSGTATNRERENEREGNVCEL